MFDTLHDWCLVTARGGYLYRLLGELYLRFPADGRDAGFFRRLGAGAQWVRSSWWPILQTAVAASAA
jgi:hypothetical protein